MASAPTTPLTITKAKLVPLGKNAGPAIDVHFNPASLVYSLENTTKQQGGTPTRKQFAAQFSGKLTMDLQFDTTGTGADVRTITNQVARLMESSANAARSQSGAGAQAQPVVSFQWGSYEFKGTMESFKETIDFFSHDGVPLRSLVSIGLARQDKVFDNGGSLKSAQQVQGSLLPGSGPPAPGVPPPPPSPDSSASSAAARGGDPNAARQLGADNGLDSLRFSAGASLQVNAGVQFNAAAGFSASASAGLSAGGGAGFSAGGGAGLSLGAGAGASIGANAGLSAGASGGVSFGASAGVASAASLQISAGVGGGALFGGQASAGVPATAGAFAGLETGRATVSTTANLNPLSILPATTSADISTGANASFSLGGAAASNAGFSSNVGSQTSFSDRLVFDSDL